MSEMIEEHLAQQHYSNLSITIVREDKALGTAGAIGYISERVTEPLLVTNADVLTTVPYSKIVREHKKSETWLTCAVRPHHYTVPFGIVHVENQRVSEVSEKPTYSWLANSGIYVLSPEACREVKKDVRLDMPELMNWGIRNGKRVVPFVLHEYWMDVGQPEDFRKANTEFKEYFGE
jgi:NDP-sugar pyrophosphorylase family protein